MIKVQDSRELQAAVLALKVVNRELVKDIRVATVGVIGPAWTSEVQSRATTVQERIVLATNAKVLGGNPPTAIAGASGRRLSGGAKANQITGGVEFGTKSRGVFTTYTSSRGRTNFRVKRRTSRQFRAFNSSGYVVYPAFAEIGPRLTSLWVQLIVRKVYDALPD